MSEVHKNIAWSEIAGSVLGIIFILMSIFLKFDILTSVIILCLTQFIYIWLCECFINKMYPIKKKRINFIIFILFLIPLASGLINLSIIENIVIFLSMIIALFSYQFLLSEDQLMMCILFYLQYTVAKNEIYLLLGLLFYLAICTVRLWILKPEKK